MTKQLWSINALSSELGTDRRTLAKRLADLPPDEEKTEAGKRVCRWRLTRVFEHLGASVRGYDGRPVEPTELHAERTRLLKAQADKAELEVDKIADALLPAEGVVLAWQRLVGAARAKFLGMPSRLAPQLAGNNDIQAIKVSITDAVYEALEELSRFKLDDISKKGDPKGENGMEAPPPKMTISEV